MQAAMFHSTNEQLWKKVESLITEITGVWNIDGSIALGHMVSAPIMMMDNNGSC